MISDESSSESETGRFKSGRSERQQDSAFDKSSCLVRPQDRFHQESDRRRQDRDSNREVRSHHRSRHSPVRRHSRERSSGRNRHAHDRSKRRSRDRRERSRSRTSKTKDSGHSKSASQKTHAVKNIDIVEKPRKSENNIKHETSPSREKRSLSRSKTSSRGNISPIRINHSKAVQRRSPVRRRSPSNSKRSPQENKRSISKDRKSSLTENRSLSSGKRSPLREKRSISDVKKSPGRGKRSPHKAKTSPHVSSHHATSVVLKPQQTETNSKPRSPIRREPGASDLSDDEVQLGSYYSMVPAIIKPKVVSDESTEIDSSDDERLRAKLLNLEKELKKTQKRKHKKKHKSKSSKDRHKSDRNKDNTPSVEVTSTTDIEERKYHDSSKDSDVVEVTSTQKSQTKGSSEEGEISSEDSICIDQNDLRHKLKKSGPKLTSSDGSINVCGPALPPHLVNKKDDDLVVLEGPSLPPKLKDSNKSIGPYIPDNLRKTLAETKNEDVTFVSSEEDDGIGPLPAGAEQKWTKAHELLEERALNIKIKQLDGQNSQDKEIKAREKWMLELPEGKAKIIGLEARSFRAKEGPDMSDRSSWTDTPEQKALKSAGLVAPKEASTEELRREAQSKFLAERDEQQEKDVKKHKKKHKRDETLLEIHQKKIKKKHKKEDKDSDKKERRPFSRDVDLQVNRFDEAQKKAIIKKAQALDTRFSRGEAKYL